MLRRLQLTPRYARLTGGGPIGKASGGIRLSASVISDAVSSGTTVGTLSVIRGTGTYVYTLTSNPGSKFAISGSSLNTAASLTAGSYPITIHADNGSGSTFDLPVSITALPVAPTNSVAPVVSGGTGIGITLTSTKGTWSEDASNSYAYQWKRDGVAIAGQTGTTYLTSSADDGHAVLCTVTASNVTGSASADSNSVSVSSVSAPATPLLALDSAFIGTSQNIPKFSIENSTSIVAGYAYRVQIQPTGGNWSSPTQDITHTITSGEDAADSFSFGFTPLSNATYDARIAAISPSLVQGSWSNVISFTVNVVAAPVNTVAPVISGSAISAGSVLTASLGTWTGTAPISYAGQWKKNGTNISGATGTSYTLVAGDLGSAITFAVTATNSQGNSTATSAAVNAGPITATFVSNASNISSGSSYTFSLNVGTAGPCLIAIDWAPNGGTITGVSIGSTAFTPVSGAAADSTSGSGSDIWYCATSPGGTQTVTVTTSVGQTRVAIAAYTLSVAPGTVTGAKVTTTGAATLSKSVTVPANGGAVSIGCAHSASVSGTVAGTNQTLDVQPAFGGSTLFSGHTGTAGTQTIGFTWTGSTDASLSIATFGP